MSKKLEVLFWRLLRKSGVFRYWYAKHLNSLMFDLEIMDIQGKEVTEKYQKKLDYIRDHK